MNDLYTAEIYWPGAIFFAADHMDLSSFTTTQLCGAIRSFEVIEIGTNWKPVRDFLLIFDCNHVPIFYRFQDITIYWSKICVFFAIFIHSGLVWRHCTAHGVLSCDLWYEIWSKKSRVRGLPNPTVNTAWSYITISVWRTDRRTDYSWVTHMHSRCVTKIITHRFWLNTVSACRYHWQMHPMSSFVHAGTAVVNIVAISSAFILYIKALLLLQNLMFVYFEPRICYLPDCFHILLDCFRIFFS